MKLRKWFRRFKCWKVKEPWVVVFLQLHSMNLKPTFHELRSNKRQDSRQHNLSPHRTSVHLSNHRHRQVLPLLLLLKVLPTLSVIVSTQEWNKSGLLPLLQPSPRLPSWTFPQQQQTLQQVLRIWSHLLLPLPTIMGIIMRWPLQLLPPDPTELLNQVLYEKPSLWSYKRASFHFRVLPSLPRFLLVVYLSTRYTFSFPSSHCVSIDKMNRKGHSRRKHCFIKRRSLLPNVTTLTFASLHSTAIVSQLHRVDQIHIHIIIFLLSSNRAWISSLSFILNQKSNERWKRMWLNLDAQKEVNEKKIENKKGRWESTKKKPGKRLGCHLLESLEH